MWACINLKKNIRVKKKLPNDIYVQHHYSCKMKINTHWCKISRCAANQGRKCIMGQWGMGWDWRRQFGQKLLIISHILFPFLLLITGTSDSWLELITCYSHLHHTTWLGWTCGKWEDEKNSFVQYPGHIPKWNLLVGCLFFPFPTNGNERRTWWGWTIYVHVDNGTILENKTIKGAWVLDNL